ncbi:NAD-dependent epimerase/dehydratase family protein [Streptomyces sp. NPDC006356]
MTTRSALIIGGSGQLGRAAAQELIRHGWKVDLAQRRSRPLDGELADAGVSTVVLDREDTDAVRAEAAGRDLVLDVVAFTPAHAVQLAGLADDIGSLVVISTGAVYAPLDGPGAAGGPRFPVPLTEDSPTMPEGGRDYGSQKAAMERLLLGTEGLPVSILRPGTLHGPHSTSLHHWSFIKRVLDKRPHVVLAHDGEARFGTSAAANVARLVRLCADQPGRRVLNAADDEALTVAEIGRRVFAAMDHEAEIVTFHGPAREDGLGFNPWNVPHPVVFAMDEARRRLGYEPAVTYNEALREDIDWAVSAVEAAERQGGSWQDVFPGLVARYGSEGWFPYAAEDAYVSSRGDESGTSHPAMNHGGSQR